MADNDPFAEPDDSERTVIRPNPGGRRTAAPAAPPKPSPFGQGQPDPRTGGADLPPPSSYGLPPGQQSRPQTNPETQIAMTGMNQLVALATPLFSLISRIRNRAQHMDPDKLRQSVMAEVRSFENAALKAGIDAQQVKVARYALCATLDDVVLNTPWGGQSSWALQSMVATFHRETVGGDRFYDLLARLEQDPAANIDMLEFIYMCLSLGFEGRLRVEHGGTDKHLQIRNSLARIIRGQRGEIERDLSPRWKGVNKPFRAVSMWKPVWIAAVATVLLLAVMFGTLTWALGRDTTGVIGVLSVLETSVTPSLDRPAPPPPPPPPPPQEVARLAQYSTFLAPEIDRGTVGVTEATNTITITLSGTGMFASASDVLQEEFVPNILRVAEALREEDGRIIVVGHSDSVPLTPGRFRDNTHLSLARAEAVARMIGEVLEDPSRISAEGRGEAEPIADNETSEGRAQNRRIEILLVKGS
jgi:type VI secretion system protein ImpK